MQKKIDKIKAISIINSFSDQEKKDFELFLSSPYFNSTGSLIKLYKYIIKEKDKINSNQITEKDIYLKCFHTDKFSYSTMRNLMSALYGSCEKFLLFDSVKNDEENAFDNEIILLKQYSKRFLDKNYYLKYKKLNDKLDYKFLRSKYFDQKIKLNDSLHNFYWLKSDILKSKENLSEKSIYNVCHIISVLSEEISSMDYLKSNFNFIPEIKPAEILFRNLDIDKFLKELKLLDDLYYYHIRDEIKFINLVLYPDDIENYFQLKKYIFKNIDDYSDSEKVYHTSRLLNFITKQYNTGKQNLAYELSEIRKLQLKKINYGKNGIVNLPMSIFISLVDLFLQTEDIKFIESLINEHLEKVEKINRENAFNYGMARIYLFNGNTEKSLEYLSKINLSDYRLKFQVKMLMIQAYYELEYFESGLSAIDSLKHFMKSNKDFIIHTKNIYTKLLKITEFIYKVRMNPEKYTMFDLDKLSNENFNNLFKRNTWYNKKTEELKKFHHKKNKLFLTG